MKNRRQFLRATTTVLLTAPFIGKSAISEFTYLQRETIKPKALKSGDTIAITSPAGAVWDDAQVEKFKGIVNRWDLKLNSDKH
jgi:hypothetical protein